MQGGRLETGDFTAVWWQGVRWWHRLRQLSLHRTPLREGESSTCIQWSWRRNACWTHVRKESLDMETACYSFFWKELEERTALQEGTSIIHEESADFWNVSCNSQYSIRKILERLRTAVSFPLHGLIYGKYGPEVWNKEVVGNVGKTEQILAREENFRWKIQEESRTDICEVGFLTDPLVGMGLWKHDTSRVGSFWEFLIFLKFF